MVWQAFACPPEPNSQDVEDLANRVPCGGTREAARANGMYIMSGSTRVRSISGKRREISKGAWCGLEVLVSSRGRP
jgi:hypothetical protein